MSRYAIQTRGLVKRYGKGEASVLALDGIDLDIRRGEFVSIMGSSGSGKSTLLHLIGLLDAPTKGRVGINGRDTSRMTALDRTMARRRNLGFVFQAFHLLPRATALQNVMLPMALAGVPRGQRKPRAVRALTAVGLQARIGNKPTQLSGGQKQRVAIARSLALDPPIIMADEPTGNLDSRTSMEIMALFCELHERGKTIIQVTHEPAMAHMGERIVTISDGRISRDQRRAP